MGAIAVFNYSQWAARYPEFVAVPEPTADAYFTEATLYLRNDGGSPVADAANQLLLLNMVTAHIAQLNWTAPGAQPTQLVGRISNASEGSVSVATENQYAPGTPQWFQQTKYGSAFWAATSAFRTMHYRPGRVNTAAVVGAPGIVGPLWPQN